MKASYQYGKRPFVNEEELIKSYPNAVIKSIYTRKNEEIREYESNNKQVERNQLRKLQEEYGEWIQEIGKFDYVTLRVARYMHQKNMGLAYNASELEKWIQKEKEIEESFRQPILKRLSEIEQLIEERYEMEGNNHE